MNLKKNKKFLITGLVAVVVIAAIIVSIPFIMRTLRFGSPRPGLMFNPDENALKEVSEYFGNSTTGTLTEYCTNNFLCGYYCRNVNPEHDFCDALNYTIRERRFG
jgi:hypothetical protein